MKVSSTIYTVLMLAGLVLAESAGGIRWTAPPGWKSQGERPMRAATYTVPAAPGDPEDGECAVFFFGGGQGGDVEANIRRWLGQFEQPDGRPSAEAAKRDKKTIRGIAVTLLDVTGTYLYSPSPMSPQKIPKKGYRMLAAIAEAPEAPVFFKFTAPEKTVKAHEAAFHQMLDSLSR
jgi:hypothetical protein